MTYLTESDRIIGKKVMANGYPGTITRVCEWTTGLVEVRLDSGTLCIDINALTAQEG